MWYAKPIGPYNKTDPECISNATEMKNFLMQNGYTLNAICGILGNVGWEGGYNPWRWQNDIILSRAEADYTDMGYGLFGYTPASKYINVANQSLQGYAPNCSDLPGNPSDGHAQCLFLIQHDEYYVYHNEYPLTWNEYKQSTQSATYLTAVWMHNYEMPASYSSLPDRQVDAQYWWDYFEGGPTPPPPPPLPRPRKKFKWWMYIPPPRPMPF